MAIRPKIKKSSDPWGADFDAEMRAITDKWNKMSKAEQKSMRNAFDREFLERIKTLPKKVVQAKVKVNKNAPKPSNVKTGNVTVIPKGSKPKTLTNAQKAAKAAAAAKRGQSQKGGRSSRGGGGMRGGVGGGGDLFGGQIK
jgi:uncharacterized membrane protein YgcG